MVWRLVGILGILTLPLILGGVLGIVPGLVLGIPGWHGVGAVVIPLLWAFGHVKQRGENFGDVSWVTYALAILGGIGLGTSIWFFGTLTD